MHSGCAQNACRALYLFVRYYFRGARLGLDGDAQPQSSLNVIRYHMPVFVSLDPQADLQSHGCRAQPHSRSARALPQQFIIARPGSEGVDGSLRGHTGSKDQRRLAVAASHLSCAPICRASADRRQ